MKKLIPAMCMLLVAALLLGTSTFAWFSMNANVTADGLEIKAVASGGLAIAPYTNNNATAPVATAFKGSATVALSTATLEPTSTKTCTTWYKGTAAAVDNYAVNDSKYSVVEDGDLGTYRQLGKFQIMSLTEGASDAVYISGLTVTRTGEGDEATELDKALRVAIVYGSTVTVYAPMYTEAPTNYTLTWVKSATDTEAATLKYGTAGSTTTIGNATHTPADLSIFAYFEGEDPNCMSVNTYQINTLAVSVSFSTTQPTA